MSEMQSLPNRQTVGAEYGGKWIAWDQNGLSIIACGETYQEALKSGESQGVQQPILEYVPQSDAGFAGGL